MWKIKRIVVGLSILTALLLWWGAAVCLQKLEWFDNSMSIRWTETGESDFRQPLLPQEEGRGKEALQLPDFEDEEKGAAPSPVFWRIRKGQSLYGDLRPEPAQAEILEYSGKIEDFLPWRFLAGTWPGGEDGCVIDEKTAHSLWGSSDVVGRTLQWNGRDWYVSGVSEGRKGLAAFPAKEGGSAAISGLWLRLPEESAGRPEAEQLLLRYRLPEGTVIDLGWYVWLAETAVRIPAVFLCAKLLLRLAECRPAVRYTGQRLFRRLWISAAGISALAMAAAFVRSVPARFLPSKWSDGVFQGLAGQRRKRKEERRKK